MLTQTRLLVTNKSLSKVVLCLSLFFEHQCEVCLSQKAINKFRKWKKNRVLFSMETI